ncbi:calcium uniporter protein [Tanacetum coccineum]
MYKLHSVLCSKGDAYHIYTIDVKSPAVTTTFTPTMNTTDMKSSWLTNTHTQHQTPSIQHTHNIRLLGSFEFSDEAPKFNGAVSLKALQVLNFYSSFPESAIQTAYLRDHKGEYEHWDPSKMETIMGYMEHSRKRTANKLITGILWSAYLLADWAVGFAIGLIANSDWSSGLNTMEAKNRYSFWASFLLVHLGERTHAFYLASSDRFKDSIIGVGDLGENYVNLIRVYVSRVKLNIPARIVKLPGKGRYAKTAKKGTLIEIEVVQYGYQFFETFRGIISYMYLSQKERSQSRHFFLNRTARDGFKVFESRIEVVGDGNLRSYLSGQGGLGETREIRRGSKVEATRRIRVGSWNVGSLTRKILELVDVLEHHRVDIMCFQET